MIITEKNLRKIIRKILSEKRKRKKRKDKSKQKSIKNLMLDKPFTTGGWPDGEDRGWLPGSDPVNVQIRDYLDSLGLL